jgi:4-amino-4-deoxy-L-arabinose transferase-like glycosyltransferase
MMNYLKKSRKKISRNTWILLVIIAVGIFLRAYNFRDWIYFSSDQVRDANLAEKVIKGEAGWPAFGPHMNHADVFVGPMYYYFQIISGKIFGAGPAQMAYPDLLFSILSIPLMYFFLKRYFSENLSLALAGLYSISFFSIQYSRFALNPNASPFFMILFLLSLLEFLSNKEKTHWKWIISLGIALGVGIQLHAITLILLLIIAFFSFIFLMKKNWRIWDKWAVVFLIMIVLNLGQIAGDWKDNFRNTKAFLNYSLSKPASDSKNTFAENFAQNADCHIQTNFFILSSLGDEEECTYLYTKLLGNKSMVYLNKIIKENPFSLATIILAAIFSFFGCILLAYYFWKEKDEKKKYFIGLIILYTILSFLIMIPVGNWLVLRYFVHLIFVPFIFLGLFVSFMAKKFPTKKIFLISAIFIFFATANIFSIWFAAKEYLSGRRSHYNYAVLGEVDSAIEYMQDKSLPQKEIYFFGESDSAWTLFGPLKYESKKKNVNLIEVFRQDRVNIPAGKAVFYFRHISKEGHSPKIDGYTAEKSEQFGQFEVYKLEKMN